MAGIRIRNTIMRITAVHACNWILILPFSMKINVGTMVFILDGSSKICAHVRSNLCYQYQFKAFDQIQHSRASGFFSSKIPIFFRACATYFDLPSAISTIRNHSPDSVLQIRIILPIESGSIYFCLSDLDLYHFAQWIRLFCRSNP